MNNHSCVFFVLFNLLLEYKIDKELISILIGGFVYKASTTDHTIHMDSPMEYLKDICSTP